MKAISGLPPKCPSLTDLGGVTWRWDEVPNRGFNPSIITLPNGEIYATVRRTNYVIDTNFGSITVPSGARHVKNVTELAKLDESFAPVEWRRIKFVDGPELKRGVEDARLLVRGDDVYLSVVMLERHTPRARMALYSLKVDEAEASYVTTYEGKDPKVPEKNWMTRDTLKTPEFDFIQSGPDGLRGGSSLVKFGDNYLAICHKTYLDKKKRYNPMTFGVETNYIRNYTHVFVEYSKDFEILRMSPEFTLRPEGGIEFATCLQIRDNKVSIAYGVDDAESWLAELPLTAAQNLLKENR